MSNKMQRQIRRRIDKAHQRLIDKSIFCGWILFWLVVILAMGFILRLKMPCIAGRPYYKSGTINSSKGGNYEIETMPR